MGRKKQEMPAPFQYSHAAECWFHASEEATRGLLEILRALDEQQGPRWCKAHRRMRRAVRRLRRAQYWAKEGLKNPLARMDDQKCSGDRRSP